MRISYLELRNYRRFRRLTLQFPDGIIGILGLNGAGKSTLIEGIAWALFGNVEEVVRTSRDGIKRLGSGSKDIVSAVLEFELDSAQYRIEREMGGKNLTMKARLKTRNDILAEGDKAVREKVESLIGMDHKSFFTSVFARQKELNALQNIAPGERKKTVLRMLRIDGIDDALVKVREEQRDRRERIKGAEKGLLDADGNERRPALERAIPLITAALEDGRGKLSKAKESEKRASIEVEEARKRRDGLKVNVDAYNTASKDLASVVSGLEEMRRQDAQMASTVERLRRLISRLPELESAEGRWEEASRRKEQLDLARGKSERAKHLGEDIARTAEEMEAADEELATLEREGQKLSDIGTRLEDAEKNKRECDARRSELDKKVGALDSTILSRRAEAETERSRLDSIVETGREGLCPTCERTLLDAYDLLVEKLTEGVKAAGKAVEKAEEERNRAEHEAQDLRRKEEALARKTKHLAAEAERLGRIESTVKAKKDSRERLEKRLAQMRIDMNSLGKIDFSEEEYGRVKAACADLKSAHDDFVRAKNALEEMTRTEAGLEKVRSSIKEAESRERAVRKLVSSLEPNRTLYDESMTGFDDKNRLLGLAKDMAHTADVEVNRRLAELERANDDLDTVKRIEAEISSERERVESLAVLVEVIASFKTYLMGKVAPALSEATSNMLELMTGGRYAEAELDEDYEIHIGDQGDTHPLDRFSGGEADLANLSLRLAISRIIADRTGANQMNFLILDEIFGSLDPGRKRSVMSALVGISGQFRQIFLITHIDEVKDLMNHVVAVEEEPDGTSTAKLLG